MTRVLGALFVAGGLALGSPGCVSDHDALKKRPPSGGSGGEDAGSDSGADGSSATGGSGGAPFDAGKDAFVEPPGESELTLVHGVVDAELIAFCVARVSEGGSELLAAPIPKAGLSYGEAIALGAIDGVDFAIDDVELHVVATDATLLASSDCSTLIQKSAEPVDGGDPAVRARALALIPKSTLSGGFSDLIVAAGCLGAPSHSDPIDDQICGAGYTPETPTLWPVVVQLSRVTQADRVGLQAVHASIASDAIDLRSVPPENTPYSPLYVASGVVPGAIEPRPPNLAFAAKQYGVPISSSTLEVVSPASSGSISVSWADVTSATGSVELADGRSYALIFLGPQLGVAQGGWWNPSAIALVVTDPDT